MKVEYVKDSKPKDASILHRCVWQISL